MAVLELDAGNSRLKWRLVDTDADKGHIVARGIIDASSDASELQAGLAEALAGNSVNNTYIKEARLSSVRSSGYNRNLCQALGEFTSEVLVARVTGHQAGVQNSYTDVSKMGVDRWLAMLAAYSKVSSNCCVVDCGTALTVDLLGHDGVHQGGYITPGLAMMQHAMAQKSPALNLDQITLGKLNPGRDSRSAIGNGITLSVFALLHHIKTSLVQDDCLWFLTGGGSEKIAALLDWDFRMAPELVLDGLALARLEPFVT